MFIIIYTYFKFRSYKKALECKGLQCKTCKLNDECDKLCDKNRYECAKDLFCKIVNDKCMKRDETCDITIKNHYNSIKQSKETIRKSTINWLDDNKIRHKDFNDYIKFYLIILLFIFLCYLIFLLLLGKITIQLSFIQRDFNYTKRRMTDTI